MALRVLVCGATGGTGLAILDAATKAGHDVTTLVRDPDKLGERAKHVKVIVGSVLDPASVEAAVRDHDVVLSALGTRPWRHQDICSEGTRAIASGMTAAGVKRLVVVSSQGVGDSKLGLVGSLGLPVLRKSFADKTAMEAFLATTDLDWTVVRPGLLTNGRPRGAWRVADDGSLVGGKIARADVAGFMLREMTAREWLHKRPTLVW